MSTIYDVAKAAGVSPKTVSRVINGDAPVSEKKKEAVNTAIEALNYVPSLAARSMKSQKSGLIGLITGAISGPEVSIGAGLPELDIVQGVQRVLAQAGKTLMISDTGGDSSKVAELIRTFREHRVEGLIYVADYHKEIELDIDSDQTPAVLINCFDQKNMPCVLPHDEEGQYLLTQQVLEAGHCKVAYLTLAEDKIASRLRLSGFKKAFEERAIAIDPELIIPADLYGDPREHQFVQGIIDKLMERDEKPTAICCGNDRLAMAVYGILRDRGIRVPDDISVVGYDDHRLVSETLYPPLTTAELPYSRMGQRAAEHLLGMIYNPQGTSCDEPILISGAIMTRKSLKNIN